MQDIDEFEPIVKNEPKFLIYKKTEMFDIIGKIEISDLDKNAQFEYRINSDFIAIRENGDVILKARFQILIHKWTCQSLHLNLLQNF